MMIGIICQEPQLKTFIPQDNASERFQGHSCLALRQVPLIFILNEVGCIEVELWLHEREEEDARYDSHWIPFNLWFSLSSYLSGNFLYIGIRSWRTEKEHTIHLLGTRVKASIRSNPWSAFRSNFEQYMNTSRIWVFNRKLEFWYG